MERAYFRKGFLLDEAVPRIQALATHEVVPVRTLYTRSERRTSHIYNEVRAKTPSQHGLISRSRGPLGSHVAWEFGDSLTGHWTDSQLEMIVAILPLLDSFVHVRQALADGAALNRSLTELLDCQGVAMIQLDGRGRIVAATDRACDLLSGQATGLYDATGFLRTRTASEPEFRRLVARAIGTLDCPPTAGSMTIPGTSGPPHKAVHVLPVGQHALERSAGARVAVLVVITDPSASRIELDARVVATTLGLTPAETEIAILVASGHTPRTVAAFTQRRPSTVRGHLKRIYRKLRVSRQVELARLVLSLEGLSSREP